MVDGDGARLNASRSSDEDEGDVPIAKDSRLN